MCTLLVLIGGCDPQVDRFEENDLHYSIFGYLNGTADTQFVRVEPLRDGSIDHAPETLDAEVTLTEQTTGRTISMRDSLFRFPRRHNFYTTADIMPEGTYRLEVHGPNSAASGVETTVPSTFPAPSVLIPVPDCFPSCRLRDPPDCRLAADERPSWMTVVSVEGVERLVAVRARYVMETPEGVWSYGHLADTVQVEPGVVEAQVDLAEDWCQIPTPAEEDASLRQRRIEVVIAAGSSNWPDYLSMDLETEMLPGTGSNVEGGIGFLGGVVTDTVVVYPYDD